MIRRVIPCPWCGRRYVEEALVVEGRRRVVCKPSHPTAPRRSRTAVLVASITRGPRTQITPDSPGRLAGCRRRARATCIHGTGDRTTGQPLRLDRSWSAFLRWADHMGASVWPKNWKNVGPQCSMHRRAGRAHRRCPVMIVSIDDMSACGSGDGPASHRASQGRAATCDACSRRGRRSEFWAERLHHVERAARQEYRRPTVRERATAAWAGRLRIRRGTPTPTSGSTSSTATTLWLISTPLGRRWSRPCTRQCTDRRVPSGATRAPARTSPRAR